MVGMICSVKGCGSKHYLKNGQESGKNFFGLPKDKEVWLKWLPAIGREDLKPKMLAGSVTQRVCSDHFTEDCFVYVRNLKKDAIPTLKLPSSTPGSCVFTENEDESSASSIIISNTNVSTQTDHDQKTVEETDVNMEPIVPTTFTGVDDDKLLISNADLTGEPSNSALVISTKGKRKREQEDLSKDDGPCTKIKTEDDLDDNDHDVVCDNDHEARDRFIESCDEYLDEKLSEIVKCHASLLNKLKTETGDAKFKMFALKLYISSPVSYRILLPFFNLPAINTMHLTEMLVSSGIKENLDLKEALRSKISVMTKQQRVCCICIDSTALKRNLYYEMTQDRMFGLHEIDGKTIPVPANHGIVLMACGILVNWKQPIAYAMVVERKHNLEFSEWVDRAISELSEMGLDVRAIVVDQEMDFTYGRNWKNISYKKTFTEIEGKKIYYIFDTIAITVSARDYLMTNNVAFLNTSTVATWKHIKQTYEVDIMEENRLVPKLTCEHMCETITIKDAKLCREIFSRSLASGIYFYAKSRQIEGEVETTVEFIKKMSDILCILYPESADSQCDQNGMYSGTNEQKHCLVEGLQFLKQIVWSSGSVKRIYRVRSFVVYLVMTIESILNLFDELHEEFGAVSILLRNLTLNVFDKYFSESIQQAEDGPTPADGLTPIKFAEIFKQSYISSLLTNTKILKNRMGEDDLTTCILEIQDYIENLDLYSNDYGTRNQLVPIEQEDCEVDLNSSKSELFFTAFLMTKCIEKHDCEELAKYLNEVNEVTNVNLHDFHRFYNFYSKRSTKSSVADLFLPPESLSNYAAGVIKVISQVFAKTNPSVKQPLAQYILACVNNEVTLQKMPCPCFPIEYFKKLCIQKKIHEIVSINNKRYTNGRTANAVEVPQNSK